MLLSRVLWAGGEANAPKVSIDYDTIEIFDVDIGQGSASPTQSYEELYHQVTGCVDFHYHSQRRKPSLRKVERV